MTNSFPANISKLPDKYFKISNRRESFDATNFVEELIKECHVLTSVCACACAMFVYYNDIFVAIYVKHNESLAQAMSRMKKELDEILSSEKTNGYQ